MIRELIITGIIAFGLANVAGCMPNYSNGQRSGTITKFSEKGFVMKSWEGELLMGGVRQVTSGEGVTSSVANVFAFSVVDPAVISDIQVAADKGIPVTLVYREWAVAPWSIDTSYVITRVKQVGAPDIPGTPIPQ
jgi:hypothetical protein